MNGGVPEPIQHDREPGETPLDVRVGEVVAGKFRVERIVGKGGMAVVVEATHLQLDERVALKFLRLDRMKRAAPEERFLQEARAAVRIKSEHVARVLDVGVRDDCCPFIVMEFLEGSDLGQVLGTSGALPVEEAAEYVVQACDGLAEAHARGIVHRDLKPENLFRVVQADGWRSIKLLDFGIAKVRDMMVAQAIDDTDQPKLAVENMGTPSYMSPEQLKSPMDVDHRTDIWSLGAVLFELITGTRPFVAVDFPTLVYEIRYAKHGSIKELRPSVPPGLQAVIDRCLAKSPAERYQNAAELALALLPFAPRRAHVPAERALSITRAAGLLTDPDLQVPGSAREPRVEAPTLDAVQTVADPPARRRSGTPWLLIGIAFAAALVGVALLLSRDGAVQSPTAPSVAAGTAPVQSAPASAASASAAGSGAEAAASVAVAAPEPSPSAPRTLPKLVVPMSAHPASPPAHSAPPSLPIHRER
ncbi:MAG: serine/threonine protein kinase [Deltaproteobacteria bacterium]|nr:serine/threonine protein kinase [Deltaproteobacteria bacterium]